MDNWREHIEQLPDVMMGKPVIKGTRLTVEHLLERMGEGWSEEELLRAHPRLRPEHLRAAQSYAAAYIGLEKTIWQDSEAS